MCQYSIRKKSHHKNLYFIAFFIVTVQAYIMFKNWSLKFNWNTKDDMSCKNYDDALPSIDTPDMFPPTNSIFFHETSCRAGLNSREACSVESAARLHPERKVYVLFSSPVSKLVLHKSCMKNLKVYPNIFYARINVEDYFKMTVFEDIIDWKQSSYKNWQVEHTDDLLKMVTLHKYGGLYLNLDVMVVKNMDALPTDFVAREDARLVNGAIMAASKTDSGILLDKIMQAITLDYKDNLWSYNGAEALTRIMKYYCKVNKVVGLCAQKCNGFEIFPPDKFYPIHHMQSKKYFGKVSMENYNDVYTHRMWHKQTGNLKIERNSFYDKLAKINCPIVYGSYGRDFGA